MKLLSAILLLITIHAFSQGKYDANWCFGIKAGINFNDTAQPVNFNTLCNAAWSAACISDSSGNLIFYVAPDTPFNMASTFYVTNAIYDNNNNIILNGDSINVGACYTDGLVLPVGANKNNYWLFYEQRIDSFDDTSDIFYDFANLTYATVSEINNSYVVTSKNQVLSSVPIEFKIAAVKHANGNDWWLLLHQSDKNAPEDSTDTFIEYLITGDSILGPYMQNIGSFHNAGFGANFGQMVFSRDGNQLACSLGGTQNAVDVFHFDRCTGRLKSYTPVPNIDTIGIGEIIGCAFSAGGSKLYVSEGFGDFSNRSILYQYSLDSPNIEANKTLLWYGNDPATTFGQLCLAPDNKIYLSVEYGGSAPYTYGEYNEDNQYLWVVENPDSTGLACNFTPYGYYLGDSARVYWGIVNFPNYNLEPLSIYQADAGNDTTICSTDTSGILIGLPPVAGVIYSWQRAAGIADTTQAQQLVKPSQSTWYYLTLTDTTIQYSCQSREDSLYVGVRQTPTALIETTTDTICPGDSAQICSVATDSIYNWNPAIGGTTKCIEAVSAGDYYVTVTDNNGCTAVSNRIAIIARQSPQVNISEDGDTLIANNAINCQWYFNDSLIQGATQNIYIAQAKGSYTVSVTDSDGCSTFSSPIVYTGIYDVSEDDNISIYPNPTNGNWQLSVRTPLEAVGPEGVLTDNNLIGAHVEILDAQGRVVYKSEIKNAHSEIEAPFAGGVYLLRIISGTSIVARKLVKL